jgi:hypothetical protein
MLLKKDENSKLTLKPIKISSIAPEKEKKIKILYINNEPTGDHSKLYEQSRSYLPFFLYPKTEMLGIGKYGFHKFLFYYFKFKPDIIVSDWVPAGFIPVFFKKIGIVKCPTIHRWEDYYTETMTNYPRWIVHFLENFTVKNADYLITVLKTLYDKSKEMKKDVFFLPYGTTPGNEKSNMNLDKLKTKKSNLKIIYAGEINSKYKRVDKIIKAAQEIDCDLFLFGEEPEGEIKEMIIGHKNIHFLGWISQEKLADVLRQGDILVNTANHEISMKFLDYVNVRKPILALNDKPSKFFKHKETAFLTDDFTKGLKELIKDKKLRKKIEQNMKKIKTYTWDEVSDLHIELYKKIIAGDKDLDKFKESYYHVPVN